MVQDRVVERLYAYARFWLSALGGEDYKRQGERKHPRLILLFLAGDELVRPAVTRLLRRYLTFDLNDPNSTAAAGGEVVVKEGFNRPTLDDSDGRGDVDNKRNGMLAIHQRSQEQMNNETLADNLQIEGEEQVRLGRLKLTHALDDAKIQSGIRAQIRQNPILPIRGRIQKKRCTAKHVEKFRQLCELLDSFLPTNEEKISGIAVSVQF
ncbi:hypothetical protein MMC22_002194 [Lobaria immixta]|nr:hypothetical protein [Lobaria immixta]